jgi:hypothetical protein
MNNIRREQLVLLALCRLRDARDDLKAAGAKKSAAKVRLAIKSTEGALRNAHRFAFKEQYDEPFARQRERELAATAESKANENKIPHAR